MMAVRTGPRKVFFNVYSNSNGVWLGSFIFVAVAISIGTAVSLGDRIRFSDERDYMTLARNLVEFGAYSYDGTTPTAFRPPSWPLLLAFGNLISRNVIWLRLINLALHLGASLILLRFTRRLGFRFMPSLITSAIYFFFPVLFFSATTFYPQTFCAFLVTLMLNVTLYSSVLAVAILGILTSVAALAVPGSALVLCLLLLLQIRRLAMRAIMIRLAVFGIAAALTLAPWTARNFILFSSIIPLSTAGGVNLLIGNSPGAGADTGTESDIDVYQKSVNMLSEPEADKKLGVYAIDWIMSHKSEAATLYVKKFLNWFNYRNNLATKDQISSIGSLVAFLSYYSVLIAAIIGSLMWRRAVEWRWRTIVFWLWAFYIVAGMTYAIIFTRVRFRVPFEIVLFILATPFVTSLTQRYARTDKS